MERFVALAGGNPPKPPNPCNSHPQKHRKNIGGPRKTEKLPSNFRVTSEKLPSLWLYSSGGPRFSECLFNSVWGGRAYLSHICTMPLSKPKDQNSTPSDFTSHTCERERVKSRVKESISSSPASHSLLVTSGSYFLSSSHPLLLSSFHHFILSSSPPLILSSFPPFLLSSMPGIWRLPFSEFWSGRSIWGLSFCEPSTRVGLSQVPNSQLHTHPSPSPTHLYLGKGNAALA